MISFTDIETHNWDEFLLSVVYGENGQLEVYDNADRWAHHYLRTNPNDVMYAHNGGGYDYLCLLDRLSSLPWNGSLAGGGILSLRINGRAELRDSMKLFPTSLDKWTGRKSQTGFDCDCGRKCGGYCTIPAKLTRSQFSTLADYCINDTKILAAAFFNSLAVLEKEGFEINNKEARGFPLRHTMGSIAWYTAKKWAGLPDNTIDDGFYSTCRAAYYGGRNECYWIKARKGWAKDISSAYPWSLCQPVPMGQEIHLEGKQAERALFDNRPGLYTVRMYQEPGRFAFLPRRIRDRVVWATGYHYGKWPLIEIQKAMSYGAKLLEVQKAIVWPYEKIVYEQYVNTVYRLKADAQEKKQMGMREVYKLYGNALSGKLAQQPDRESLIHSEVPPEGCEWLINDFFIEKTHDLSDCARPWHAAYLTARVRGIILDHNMRNYNTTLYNDTDSAYLSEPDPTGFGSQLGAWADEGTFTDWICAGPKVYQYIKPNGESVNRAKGMPDLTPQLMVDVLERRPVVNERGVYKIRGAIRNQNGIRMKDGEIERYNEGLFRRRHLSRQLQGDPRLCGCRWINADGSTLSLHFDGEEFVWPGVSVKPREILKWLRK